MGKEPREGIDAGFSLGEMEGGIPKLLLVEFPCNQSYKSTWSTCDLRCDYYILNRVELRR